MIHSRKKLGTLWAAASVILGMCSGGALAAQTALPAQAAVTTVKPDEGSIPRHAGALQVVPMTLEQQGRYYARHSFDPGSLLSPALPAAILMLNPPHHYPREWKDGGGAFGRNFGNALAAEQAANAGKFLGCAVFGEDPRYFPDTHTNPFHRVYHALAFTVVDNSTHGRPRLALSNFAGAAAGGFVGMAYLPDGYTDAIHAGQRAGGTFVGYVPTQIVGFATHNVTEEFSPELKWLRRKLHIPFSH